ncbi:MAG: calcineurin-like phosphoesterase C-terminal domain-containing protein, partial [Pseudomonadota bacterium]
ENVGVESLPFRHIIAGAGSGGWFHGDFDVHGVPMALQRMGGPMGWLDLQFDGADYVETYYGANTGRDRRMWLSINTPDFRTWFESIREWALSDRRTRDPIPPLSIHDLPDVKILTPEDLSGGSFLTANVWDGTTETRVSAEIGGQMLVLERTQTASGDAPKIGSEWADPFATQRQLSVARYAMQSRSGEERNQGYEAFKGSSFGPAAPQPQTSAADRNMHLWRVQLPADLPLGVHRIDVTSVDRHARETVDTIVIEVREERPPMRFRKDVFFATPDGPPIR